MKASAKGAALLAERVALQAEFEILHQRGAERHPHVWFMANRAAVEAMWNYHIDTSDVKMKALVSAVILRVLDCAAS